MQLLVSKIASFRRTLILDLFAFLLLLKTIITYFQYVHDIMLKVGICLIQLICIIMCKKNVSFFCVGLSNEYYAIIFSVVHKYTPEYKRFPP